MIPPLFIGEAGIYGIDDVASWPPFLTPPALAWTNVGTVVSGVSLANGTTFNPPANSGSYPYVDGTLSYTETYTASVSGTSLNEQWSGTDTFTDPSTPSRVDTHTFTSNYDIVSGAQTFTTNEQFSITEYPANNGAGCTQTQNYTVVGTGCFNWTTGQECGACPASAANSAFAAKTVSSSGTNSCSVCKVNPADVKVSAEGGYSADGKPTTMFAAFTPHDPSGKPMDLGLLQQACGFIAFDWQQQITSLPAPSAFRPSVPSFVPNNLSFDGSFKAPPAVSDPPPGGFTYEFNDAYPFYYALRLLPPGSGTTACLKADVVTPDNLALTMDDCPGNPELPPGSTMSFTTSLVGVTKGSPVPMSDQGGIPGTVYKTWNWTSNFTGTTDRGGVQTASAEPLNASSGTGGVVITSIDGVTQMPPTLKCSASPNSIWPPNGNTVTTTISGQITQGSQTVASGATNFLVTDSQSSAQQNGAVTMNSDGTFSFTVPLVASRAGNIKSGRQYTIAVTANDAIGNQGSCSAVVTVPHDQGK